MSLLDAENDAAITRGRLRAWKEGREIDAEPIGNGGDGAHRGRGYASLDLAEIANRKAGLVRKHLQGHARSLAPFPDQGADRAVERRR